ncbi:MAG: hypothetical protein KJ622_06140 [Alphaproteobacteria bacterium]|nr:hypothetical protein [Alphaproteobacteria bacterium]
MKQILGPRDFAKLGLNADYSGADMIKVSRNGRSLGRIKKNVGKYVYYSEATGLAEFSSFSAEKVLAGIAQRG